MDLRQLPTNLTPQERIDERRRRIAANTGADLDMLQTQSDQVGGADERNCEQMFGAVPVPVGYAGPLTTRFSDGTTALVHLPLATTEGALVASCNRGCKVTSPFGIDCQSEHIGISRSIAWRHAEPAALFRFVESKREEWRRIGEATSRHLRIVHEDLEQAQEYVFVTLYADTDEAMGMNMITIAAQAIGQWVSDALPGTSLVTVAANVDSDKKPSRRVAERGRGYRVRSTVRLSATAITDGLKADPAAMAEVARAKLDIGSHLAGALGQNLHAANIVAALAIATGQDPAHVVEGSLAKTTFRPDGSDWVMTCELPAVIVGVRGGGTGLPAQNACLNFLLQPPTSLPRKQQLAETFAAAVLAGELSLLAAQASQTLASAHRTLAR